MTSDQNQFEELFPEAYRDFEVELLFADLAKSLKKALNKDDFMPGAKEALLGKLCGYRHKETQEKVRKSAGTLRQDLSNEVYPAIEELLKLGEKIEWKTAKLPKLLEKYRKSLKGSLSIDIPWQEVCSQVLEQQRKQWLTSYPLGSGDRKIPEMYIPLELVEREPEDLPRIPSELEPEKWSVREQEKRTPISNQEFFEQVLQGNSPKSNGKRIAIIGEPGAGKTTLLQKIGSEVKELPIWIDLADLQPNKHESLQDYLTEIWLTEWALPIIKKRCPEAKLSSRIATDDLKNALVSEFEKGNVWLLLDGVDEMALTFRQPLSWIDRQLRGCWIADAKVVLTCRLNIWSESGNYLPDFDVYRNVDFTDEQVEEFIEKWFVKEPDSYEKLKKEWNQANDRIKSLIRNPLRLTLLCLTWKKGGEKLPETKAGLYQRLVEGHYNWKKDKEGFALCTEKQKELNKWLGELAKAALDSEDSRFRLRKSFIESFSTEHKLDDSLRELAIKVGWLVEVGLPTEDEKDADESVYAFFHPTFQEYFAALAIDDWHFFLNHNNENPNPFLKHNNIDCVYRIFESQWKEAIFMWFGQKGGNFSQAKEEFIKVLVNFQDGCSDFYRFQAYFLAASCIEEFCSCSRTDEIVEQIIKWSFGYCNNNHQEKLVPLQEPISEGAMAVLPKMAHPMAISALINLLETAEDENARIPIYSRLKRWGIGDMKVIDSLVKVLDKTEEQSTLFNAAFCLDIINPGNPHIAIALLRCLDKIKNDKSDHKIGQNMVTEKLRQIELGNQCKSFEPDKRLIKDENNDNLRSIAEVRWEIKLDNPQASHRLIKILEMADDEISCYIAAELLLQVDANHQMAITTLINLLENAEDMSIRQLSTQSLGKTTLANQNVINALANVLEKDECKSLHLFAALSLEQIGTGNEQAIKALFSKVINSTNKNTFLPLYASCLKRILQGKYLGALVTRLKNYFNNQLEKNNFCHYEYYFDIVWHCAQTMSYHDFYDAWYSQLSITHPEAPDNIPASNSFIAQNLTLTQKIQIIQSTVTSDPMFKDTVKLICIDGSQFSDQNNPATDIYIEMVEQGCPEQQEEPTTMQQLKKYWRLRLKSLEKRVALLFYNSKADREFSENCLTALSTFGGAIAIITTQHCENVKLFDRNDPDLIDSVLKWLRRDILES